jgi:hypothetical protein
MRFGGLIVNLTHEGGLDGHSVEQVAALLAPELGEQLARRTAANLADFDVLARRDARSIEELSRVLGEPAPLPVRHLDGDPQDLRGIAVVSELLFG